MIIELFYILVKSYGHLNYGDAYENKDMGRKKPYSYTFTKAFLI